MGKSLQSALAFLIACINSHNYYPVCCPPLVSLRWGGLERSPLLYLLPPQLSSETMTQRMTQRSCSCSASTAPPTDCSRPSRYYRYSTLYTTYIRTRTTYILLYTYVLTTHSAHRTHTHAHTHTHTHTHTPILSCPVYPLPKNGHVVLHIWRKQRKKVQHLQLLVVTLVYICAQLGPPCCKTIFGIFYISQHFSAPLPALLFRSNICVSFCHWPC